MPIPSISITPAPPEVVHPEPYSPIPPAKLDADKDGYRSKWLSLPAPSHSAPLRPTHSPSHKGLSQDQFNSILKVSRDQRAKVETDLCKEVALKNQKFKQLERRARFLCKVEQPSFTATIPDPQVHLESPTTTHCFTSPCGFDGLEAAAEKLQNLVVVPTASARDKQIKCKLPLPSSKFPGAAPRTPTCFPPSLDEIAARLKPMHVSFKKDGSRPRLPSFLTTLSLSSGSMGDQIRTVPVQHHDPYALKLGSSRLVTVNVVG